MSDYCECCSTNAEHIRQHYDPSALTRPGEDPEAVLAIFRRCREAGDPCPLDLADIEEYLDELDPAPETDSMRGATETNLAAGTVTFSPLGGGPAVTLHEVTEIEDEQGHYLCRDGADRPWLLVDYGDESELYALRCTEA